MDDWDDWDAKDAARSAAADRWHDEATPSERAEVSGRWPGDLPGVRVIRYSDGTKLVVVDGPALVAWRRAWPCSGTRGASALRVSLDRGGAVSAVSCPGADPGPAANEVRAILSAILWG